MSCDFCPEIHKVSLTNKSQEPFGSTGTALQISQVSPTPKPTQVTIHPTQIASSSHDALDSGIKRQKFECHRLESECSAESETLAIADSRTSEIATLLVVSSHAAEKQLHPSRPRSRVRAIVDACRLNLIENATREDVKVKSYHAEFPKITPQYVGDVPTDYFPWIGGHSEDSLNENSTKRGYFDKQSFPSESNAARPSVFPGLKSTSGLQILSSQFVLALDQSRLHRFIKSNFTFKPPPRVTLTDAKRENWLRDLANPTIPLRRLSRTIPHGIRGKALLDHCLGKNIPTWRAIWLARCVGANEIRALKRKGTTGAFIATGGENKWTRDWTSNIQQSIGMLVESCGSDRWKTRLMHGLQLVVHLQWDHLLDKEHFLDWILMSFIESSYELLPMWLLILQFHLKEIAGSRYRGRQAAEAVLEHLHQISDLPHRSIFSPLHTHLTNLLRVFVLNAPVCFVLPRSWVKLGPVLGKCLQDEGVYFEYILQVLSERNLWLTRVSKQNHAQKGQNSSQQLVATLDDYITYLVPDLSSVDRIKPSSEPESNVITLLNWSTTRYRSGIERVYIAARLLRHWSQIGIDLDTPLLKFLGCHRAIPGAQPKMIIKLVAELIRTRHFSVGKYLQWLMARQTQTNEDDDYDNNTFETNLLMNIPLHGLPKHLLSLRRILMVHMTSSNPDDRRRLNLIRKSIVERLHLMRKTGYFAQHNNAHFADIAELNGATKFDISRWIGNSIFLENSFPHTDDCEGESKAAERGPIALNDFDAIYRLLVVLEDFTVLADVITIIFKSGDRMMVEFAANIVNVHRTVFLAVGALDKMFHNLLMRVEQNEINSSFNQSLLESLIDIGIQLPNAQQQTLWLRQNLLHKPEPSNSATTPFSDYLAGLSGLPNPVFADEINTLFGVENNIDLHTQQQFFSLIIHKIENSWSNTPQSWIGLVQSLALLRSFDAESFDSLFTSWLDDILCSTGRPDLATILIPFVCADIVTLQKVVAQLLVQLKTLDNADLRRKFSVDMIDLLIVDEGSLKTASSQRIYRFTSQQRHVVLEGSVGVSRLIRYILETFAEGETVALNRIHILMSHPSFHTLAQTIITYDRQAVVELGQSFASERVAVAANHLLNLILEIRASSEICIIPFSQEVEAVLVMLNDFNVNICTLKIGALLALSRSPTLSSGPLTKTVINTLIQNSASMFQTQAAIYKRLLCGLPKDFAEMFHAQAVSALLFLVPNCSPSFIDDLKNPASLAVNVEGLLSNIIEIEPIVDCEGFFPFLSIIAGKIDSLHSLIRPELRNSNTVIDSVGNTLHCSNESRAETYSWVNLLLRLLISHQRILQHEGSLQSALSQLILSLSLLLVSIELGLHSYLANRIFDTIALLSDFLSDESRIHCACILRNQHHIHDLRIRFLLGDALHNEKDDHWLPSAYTIAATASSVEKRAPATTTKISNNAKFVPYPLQRWELVQDATPMLDENNSSLSLGLFGTEKVVI